MEGKNALLESPTGTGKTLMMLTSALACVEKLREKGKFARVVYASRTFTQLD